MSRQSKEWREIFRISWDISNTHQPLQIFSYKLHEVLRKFIKSVKVSLSAFIHHSLIMRLFFCWALKKSISSPSLFLFINCHLIESYHYPSAFLSLESWLHKNFSPSHWHVSHSLELQSAEISMPFHSHWNFLSILLKLCNTSGKSICKKNADFQSEIWRGKNTSSSKSLRSHVTENSECSK